MKKSVLFLTFLLLAAGCSAVNNNTNPNQAAAPNPSPTQVDTATVPNQTPATAAPATNPSAVSTTEPTKPPAAQTPEPAAPAPNNPKPVIPPPPAGSKETPYVTKQQIDAIALNATYEEVSKSIGLGKLVSVTEHQAIYQYQGKNGGTAKLTFWDGKLNSKGMSDLN